MGQPVAAVGVGRRSAHLLPQGTGRLAGPAGVGEPAVVGVQGGQAGADLGQDAL